MSQNTIRYCKICGSVIDAKTKKCDQCGKQYFKWTKIKTVIVLLSLLLISSIILNITLFNEIHYANSRFEYWRNEAKRLEESEDTAHFYSTFAAIVTEDSKMYHVYGCESLDESAPFSIYNIRSATAKGYYPCPKCHN